MKEEIVQILACPVCQHSPLELAVSSQQGTDVTDGILSCPSCGRQYPIEDKIPRMIPPEEGKDRLSQHAEVRQANIAYHDVVADVYDEDIAQSVHQNEFNQARIESIIGDLAQKSGGKVFLDIGCGTGNVLKFGKKYFQRAVGMDASVNMLKIASERGMQVVQADALFPPFTPDTFDVVCLFSVLHHIYDYPAVLARVGAVLKQGGFLYTDWDPQEPPLPKDGIAARFLGFVAHLFKKPALRDAISDRETAKAGRDFLKEHPEYEEVYRLAEYHERADKRGLNPVLLRQSLLDAGFSNVNMNFHWWGKSTEELYLSFVQRLEFKLKSRLSKQPVDRFMENIMIIARK